MIVTGVWRSLSLSVALIVGGALLLAAVVRRIEA